MLYSNAACAAPNPPGLHVRQLSGCCCVSRGWSVVLWYALKRRFPVRRRNGPCLLSWFAACAVLPV
jgi:hypothetical protein